MLKKYSVSLLAATVAASFSVSAGAETALQVVDLGTAENAYVAFPGGMNSLGEAVVVNRELWQQNIRFELLTQDAFEQFDFDDLSDADYRRIRDALNNSLTFGQDPLFQKLATQITHIFDGQVVELDGFDQADAETNRMTDSVNFVGNDINTARIVVGQAGEPYQRRWTTDRNNNDVQYFMRDTFPRAFAYQQGEVIFLEGEPDLFQGGTGSAFAINENNQIVGRASISHTASLDSRIALCQQTPEENDDGAAEAYEELNVCVWRYWFGNEVAPQASGNARAPIFMEQAYMWTLEDNGEVTKQLLGGFERTFAPPEEDDEDQEQRPPEPLRSNALDINNQGIAVGSAFRSVTFFNGVENVNALTSVVYRDGDIIPLQEEFRSTLSEATGINDNNIVVGYSNLQVGQNNRPRAYWTDLNNPEAGLNYPNGFFSTSGWRPRAVNNQNVMVGRAEVTAEVTGQRPTIGFMYDIDTDTITNLNELLPCQSDYRIVDAYDINDNGEIMALATTQVGIPVDGEEEVSGRLRAVRLQAGGEGTCGPDAEPVERQGASVHPIAAGFMALFALLITRRRVKKS
ncbi:MAG: DUF3466 family protein [Idiomarina sp.]|nr:DUF3466 family protein [Idiomarina sp.]